MQSNIRMGGPIALIVVGAILYFALGIKELAEFNLTVVGVILGAAGVIWLLLELVTKARGKNTTATTRTQVADSSAPGGVATSERQTTVEES